MITVTKDMIREMHANSDCKEIVGSTYDISANSMEMKDEDLGLSIYVYSLFTNQAEVLEMIRDGELDAEKAFTENSWKDKVYEIECDDEYTLTDDAKAFLIELHEEFCDTNREYSILHINYSIENRTETA